MVLWVKANVTFLWVGLPNTAITRLEEKVSFFQQIVPATQYRNE